MNLKQKVHKNHPKKTKGEGRDLDHFLQEAIQEAPRVVRGPGKNDRDTRNQNTDIDLFIINLINVKLKRIRLLD